MGARRQPSPAMRPAAVLAQAAAALALALNWATIGSAAVEPLAPPGLPPVRVIAFSSEPLDPAFLDNAKDAFGSANVLHLGLTSTFRGAASRPVYNLLACVRESVRAATRPPFSI